MEAVDIRIGNYVKYNGMFLQVISIVHPAPREGRFNDKWIIDLACDGFITATLDEIEPIAITEELIKDAGFEVKILTARLCFGDDLHLLLAPCNDKGKGEYYVMIKGSMCDLVMLSKRIFYLHELQNLHYALTGKELRIKQSEL